MAGEEAEGAHVALKSPGKKMDENVDSIKISWSPILSREQSNMSDTWTEYLCATRDGAVFGLGICVHELLGYIPQEWFDDDGEPLPQYRNKDGSLRVPAEFAGQSVVGHDGEYLLGSLGQWNSDQSASVSDLSLEAVNDALRQIGWNVDDASELLAALVVLKSS